MVRSIFKRLLFVQLMVSSIAILGNTIDGVIVARLLGTDAIAACGLLNPFIIVAAAISDIIASGTQVVCSKSIGADEKEAANRQLGVAFCFALLISGGIAALGFIYLHQLCVFLGANPGTQLLFDTEAYARGLLPSLISATSIALLMFTCVSNGDMKRCRIAGAGIVVLNIVFSIASAVIFDAGLFGIGLSTSLSSYLVLFYLLGHFRDKSASLRPSFSGLSVADFGQIVAIGSPRATYKACTFLLILLFNNILLDFCGQDHVVAYSVVRTIYGIASFATAALYYCTSLITSTFYGEENRRALYDTVRAFTHLSLIMGIAGFLFTAIFGRYLALLFLDAGTVAYEITVQGLVIISVSLPLCAITACFQNYFIGTGHQCWGVVLNIITILVLTPVAGFLLMIPFDTSFVYAAFPAGYLLELILIGICVARKKRQSPFRAESYLFVPDSFGVPQDHELSLAIHTLDELGRAQGEISSFCRNAGLEARDEQAFQALSLYAGTCMKRARGHTGEACYARFFHRDRLLNLIVWNTFGLIGSNPISQTLSQGKELLRKDRQTERKPEGADEGALPCDRERTATPNEKGEQLDPSLTELLVDSEYSLNNPFGLERLNIAFGIAQTDPDNARSDGASTPERTPEPPACPRQPSDTPGNAALDKAPR